MNYICGLLLYQYIIKEDEVLSARELNQIEFLLTLTLNDFINLFKFYEIEQEALKNYILYINFSEIKHKKLEFPQTTYSKMKNYGIINEGLAKTGIDISTEGEILIKSILEVKDILLEDEDLKEIHEILKMF